jgi:hypothetical protein
MEEEEEEEEEEEDWHCTLCLALPAAASSDTIASPQYLFLV